MGLRRNLPNCSGILKPSSNIQFRLTGFLSKPLTIKLNHPDTMNESVGDQRYQVVNLMQLVYHVTIILCASLRHYSVLQKRKIVPQYTTFTASKLASTVLWSVSAKTTSTRCSSTEEFVWQHAHWLTRSLGH